GEPGGADQVGAQFGPDAGQLFFVSDRGGVGDVYRLELDGGRLFQVTRAATGVSGVTRLSPALAVAARGARLAFSVFAGAPFEIHSLDPAAAAGRPVEPGEPADAGRIDLGGPAGPAVAAAPPAAAAGGRPAAAPPRPAPPPAAAELAGPAPPPADGNERIVPYHPRLQLEAVSPGVDLDYSSLGYAIGGDVSAPLSDAPR